MFRRFQGNKWELTTIEGSLPCQDIARGPVRTRLLMIGLFHHTPYDGQSSPGRPQRWGEQWAHCFPVWLPFRFAGASRCQPLEACCCHGGSDMNNWHSMGHLSLCAGLVKPENCRFLGAALLDDGLCRSSKLLEVDLKRSRRFPGHPPPSPFRRITS